MTKPPPLLSVIMPAHRAGAMLDRTLTALLASDLPRDRWELVVVDDASGDDTPHVAARYADTVVKLPGRPNGPAYARNRGAEMSRGTVLVFVDADVEVHPTALRQFAELFDARPEVAAAFGSYDDAPAAPGLISQYRNLLHHYVHQLNAGESATFWAGLGAIRRSVFLDVGGYDEWHYYRPQIEDIELGRRIHRLGHSVVLDPTIQGTHLKRWSLWDVVRTDFRHRGVPWMWLILREGTSKSPATLNLRARERWATALVNLAAVIAVGGAALGSGWIFVVAAAMVGIGLSLNFHLYRYLRSKRGLTFALSAIPLQVGYYLSNGFSVVTGWLVHALLGEPLPRVDTAALAQLDVKTWPPVPAPPRRGIWSDDGS